jgi:hypothetical protein
MVALPPLGRGENSRTVWSSDVEVITRTRRGGRLVGELQFARDANARDAGSAEIRCPAISCAGTRKNTGPAAR